MTEHTPGPWTVSGVRTRESGEPVLQICAADGKCYAMVFYSDKTPAEHRAAYADARLIAAAPELLAALILVRTLIVDAAATGFNCHDGDWAERLFASQQVSFDAVIKAGGNARTQTQPIPA